MLAALTLATPSPAQEAEGPDAQASFEEGMALMKQGDYERACPLLERSVKLDPAMAPPVKHLQYPERKPIELGFVLCL